MTPTETDQATDLAPARRRSPLVMVPLAVFLGLAAMFAFALRSGDPSKIPSVLIGKPAPALDLAPMAGLREGEAAVPGIARGDLAKGEPVVVNFFASWCAPCVQEHPMLGELARRTKVRILGINHKDPDPGGRRFLGRYGNPYAAVGLDSDGRAAIEWGVYGMPETFVVAGDGRILAKHVGPITPEVIERELAPVISAARKQ